MKVLKEIGWILSRAALILNVLTWIVIAIYYILETVNNKTK